ncbi:50S ribosomal protein L23 [candidate division KSB1 bacterium]|nr:50S ribosomal protein L23 [candidate division KSB1 bacterium]
MRTPEEILRRPLLTEKILKLTEKQNRYGFEVLPEANKHEVKVAVEKKFGVKVLDVHIVNVKGKRKRMNTRRGMTFGKRSDRKKAIVTVEPDKKIDFYSGGVVS